MSKKVIDVSSYQSKIDWSNVKKAGVAGAILKVIRKDLNPDKQFENNWNGCMAVGMPIVGVYNYSYATTTEKAKSDALRVISVLNGRKAKVWMDVEDNCLKNKGHLLIEIIRAYQKVITDAGYEFGVYTGRSFYNSYIKRYASELKCDFWIARYPSSSESTVKDKPNDKYRPTILHPMEGWQYTSHCVVPGVSSRCDMSIWYDEIHENKGDSTFADAPVASEEMAEDVKMKTIKKGASGKAVRVWQAIIGVKVDGNFGKDTEAATIAFQKKSFPNDKSQWDGVVGTKTWRAGLESI